MLARVSGNGQGVGGAVQAGHVVAQPGLDQGQVGEGEGRCGVRHRAAVGINGNNDNAPPAARAGVWRGLMP